MKRHPGYCPLCGNMSLALMEKDSKVWAYCDQGGLTLEKSHTSYVVGLVPSMVPAKKKESN